MKYHRTPAVLLAVVFTLLAAACSDTATTTSQATTTSTTTPAPETTAPETTTTTSTTTSTTTTSAPTTTQPARTAVITSLPDGPCAGLGNRPPLGDGEITFQVGQRLYATTPDGRRVRCLLEIPPDEASVLFPPRLEWGEAGDRLIIGEHAYLASEEVTPDFEAVSTLHWTKPTGTSVLSIHDGRLVKRKVESGAATDVTFLERHDVVLYHPSGLQIISVGEDAAGAYGIFVASNTGTRVRQLVDVAGATVTELDLLYDGISLYFIAVHDDGVSHLHELSLFSPEVSTTEDEGSDIHKTTAPLYGLELSAWDFFWAANEACGVGEGPSMVLPSVFTLPAELEGVPAQAVGWLPRGRLAVITFPAGCDLPGDLWVMEFSFSERPATATLLYSGAEEAAASGLDIQEVGVANAATRTPAPEPPPPLGEVELVEA